MKFPLFVAFRYLIAKKTNNIINWITWIAVTVVCIVSAALIIILSAMNGLSDSVMDLYSDFDPDLKITPAHGKRINLNDLPLSLKELENEPGVAVIGTSIEETVLLKYRDHQEVATMKGVLNNFDTLTNISNNMVDGFYATYGNGQQMCVMGTDLALKLGVNISALSPIYIYLPNFEGQGIPGDYFKNANPKPVGVFDITSDFNAKYLIVSSYTAASLLGIKDQVNAIEIRIDSLANEQAIKQSLIDRLGDDYVVKTRFEQNEFLFRSINAEKWITLMILSLVVVLAVFNVIGSLTILIIDKRRDIYVLRAMGCSPGKIKLVFWLVGLLISLAGGILGISIGLLACWLQEHFCLFGYGAAGRIECFPMLINASDVFIVFLMVNGITAITSLAPVVRIGGIARRKQV